MPRRNKMSYDQKLKKMAERRRLKLMNETPEERSKRLSYEKLRSSLMRACETPEEREARLEYMRTHTRRKRKDLKRRAERFTNMFGPDKANTVSNGHCCINSDSATIAAYRTSYIVWNTQKEMARQQVAKHRAMETPEQRAIRLEKNRVRAADMRASESEEARVARLARERERVKYHRHSLETPEQKAIRLEKHRVRAAATRAGETPEERAARLARERDRVRAKRYESRIKMLSGFHQQHLQQSVQTAADMWSRMHAMAQHTVTYWQHALAQQYFLPQLGLVPAPAVTHHHCTVNDDKLETETDITIEDGKELEDCKEDVAQRAEEILPDTVTDCVQDKTDASPRTDYQEIKSDKDITFESVDCKPPLMHHKTDDCDRTGDVRVKADQENPFEVVLCGPTLIKCEREEDEQIKQEPEEETTQSVEEINMSLCGNDTTEQRINCQSIPAEGAIGLCTTFLSQPSIVSLV